MKAVITVTGKDTVGIIADALNVDFAAFADELSALGRSKGLDIHAMHEDIFNTMHHV